MPTLGSTLLLTLLLAIGLVFFLRAASKDRTTVVEVHSPRPPVEVLEGLATGSRRGAGNRSRRPRASGCCASAARCAPAFPWPCCCPCWAASGRPVWAWCCVRCCPRWAGGPCCWPWWARRRVLLYRRRAARPESLELRLINEDVGRRQHPAAAGPSRRADRDRTGTGAAARLASDGALLSSPI